MYFSEFVTLYYITASSNFRNVRRVITLTFSTKFTKTTKFLSPTILFLNYENSHRAQYNCFHQENDRHCVTLPFYQESLEIFLPHSKIPKGKVHLPFPESDLCCCFSKNCLFISITSRWWWKGRLTMVRVEKHQEAGDTYLQTQRVLFDFSIDMYANQYLDIYFN